MHMTRFAECVMYQCSFPKQARSIALTTTPAIQGYQLLFQGVVLGFASLLRFRYYRLPQVIFLPCRGPYFSGCRAIDSKSRNTCNPALGWEGLLCLWSFWFAEL